MGDKHTIYLGQKDNRWVETNEAGCLVSMDYVSQNITADYRDIVSVNIRDIKVNLFGWEFGSEIVAKRSSNFRDTFKLEFSVQSVSPSRKCYETVFSGNYISHPDDEANSLGTSIFTGMYLIALCNNPEYAKDIYEKVLAYPFMPYNKAAFMPTYGRALVALSECGYMVNMINDSEKMNDVVAHNFYNNLVDTYNSRLYEFSNLIVKYRMYSKISVE